MKTYFIFILFKIPLLMDIEVILITYGILFIGELGDKSDLENVCWACDVPIDYAKPVKPKEDETEEIHVDKKHKTS